MNNKSLTSFRPRGFTLIELMIVVVIMGVLASLAIYGVSNYIQKSKSVEAREIVGKIMAAQEDYFVETQRYMNVTGGLDDGASEFYPSDGDFNGMKKIMWGADDSCKNGDNTCGENYKALGVMVNQPVMFRYASIAYPAGFSPSGGTYAGGLFPSGYTAPRAGYVVVAVSDLDGSGSGYSVVAGSAAQADLYSSNLGQ